MQILQVSGHENCRGVPRWVHHSQGTKGTDGVVLGQKDLQRDQNTCDEKDGRSDPMIEISEKDG